MWRGPQAKLCSHGGIQSVVCVPSGLDFKAAGGSTEVIVCPIICVDDINSL